MDQWFDSVQRPETQLLLFETSTESTNNQVCGQPTWFQDNVKCTAGLARHFNGYTFFLQRGWMVESCDSTIWQRLLCSQQLCSQNHSQVGVAVFLFVATWTGWDCLGWQWVKTQIPLLLACMGKAWWLVIWLLSFRWLYEGISREKAEELLLLPFNHQGSFLIRENQIRKGIIHLFSVYLFSDSEPYLNVCF